MNPQLERWGERYFPIGVYWRKRFGEKVYKISVSVAERCPIRDGSKVCIFCDEWGSAAWFVRGSEPLPAQITRGAAAIAKRFKARRFLVYFQAYTHTLARTDRLAQSFETALKQPDIAGLVVGTRPDCLPKRAIELFARTAEQTYLMIELGQQSLDDNQLRWMRRGHDVDQGLQAIEALHRQTRADIALHLMLGLPGETEESIVETAHRLNELPIAAVKLHNLHVLKNTPLAERYGLGTFQPIEMETYAQRVAIFLSHLRPEIAVQRLVASANRHEELVAPQWTRLKMAPTQYIRELLQRENIIQGQALTCIASPETIRITSSATRASS